MVLSQVFLLLFFSIGLVDAVVLSQMFLLLFFSIGINWTGRCYGPSSDGLCSLSGFCRSSHSADTALLENRRADSSCGEISCSGG